LEAAKLWFTRTHNEYGCLPFLNLMFAAGKENKDLVSLLDKGAAAVLEAKRKDEGSKVWIFVLHDNGQNLERADAYAQQVHGAEGWHQFVDWREGGQTNFVVRVTELLDFGVHVAVAIQRVGELIVGGPGVGHGLVQHGTTLAVAVNICDLDLVHLPVRMATKGGDLAHRANRETAGPKPWFKVTSDSVISIIRSLRDDLYRQMCPPFPSSAAAATAALSPSPPSTPTCTCFSTPSSPADRLKRLRRLEAGVSQLSTSLRAIQTSMRNQGLGSSYSKTLTRQGWARAIEGDLKILFFIAFESRAARQPPLIFFMACLPFLSSSFFHFFEYRAHRDAELSFTNAYTHACVLEKERERARRQDTSQLSLSLLSLPLPHGRITFTNTIYRSCSLPPSFPPSLPYLHWPKASSNCFFCWT